MKYHVLDKDFEDLGSALEAVGEKFQDLYSGYSVYKLIKKDGFPEQFDTDLVFMLGGGLNAARHVVLLNTHSSECFDLVPAELTDIQLSSLIRIMTLEYDWGKSQYKMQLDGVQVFITIDVPVFECFKLRYKVGKDLFRFRQQAESRERQLLDNKGFDELVGWDLMVNDAKCMTIAVLSGDIKKARVLAFEHYGSEYTITDGCDLVKCWDLKLITGKHVLCSNIADVYPLNERKRGIHIKDDLYIVDDVSAPLEVQ